LGYRRQLAKEIKPAILSNNRIYLQCLRRPKMATKRKFGQHAKADKDKRAMDAKGEGADAKAMADAQALKKELEKKEQAALKNMAHSSPPSGLVSVERKRGTPAGSTNKATAQAALSPQSQPSNDKLQTVLSYLLKDSGNLDLIYSIVIRLR
jgi:uncharacterized protein involved in copper resistance